MRLVAFAGPDGSTRVGLVTGPSSDELVVDLVDVSRGVVPAGDVLTFMALGAEGRMIAERYDGTAGGLPLPSLRLRPPIARPGKLLAVAGNFQAHIEEGGGKRLDKETQVPKVFMKPSTSIIGPSDPLVLPHLSDTVDWELELAIIIGRQGKDIPLERAREHIFGYCVINDISARSLNWDLPQTAERPEFDQFFDWLNGKWCDGFAPLGPWVTTSDSLDADPNELEMTLKVNGKVMQQGSTADMIFTPEEIIAFASSLMTLEPGDIIAGGTLDGVGHSNGVYLKHGDELSGTIGNLGTLTTHVKSS